jgi:hypothetical protein
MQPLGYVHIALAFSAGWLSALLLSFDKLFEV